MGLFDHSADRVGNNTTRGAGHVRGSFQARHLVIDRQVLGNGFLHENAVRVEFTLGQDGGEGGSR